MTLFDQIMPSDDGTEKIDFNAFYDSLLALKKETYLSMLDSLDSGSEMLDYLETLTA